MKRVTAIERKYDMQTRVVATLAAAFITMFLLLHLFRFEEVTEILAGYLRVDVTAARLVLGLVVVTELFTLPVLLGITLSPLMRIVSLAAAWPPLVCWLVLARLAGENDSGYLGGVIEVPIMATTLLVLVMMAILAFAQRKIIAAH